MRLFRLLSAIVVPLLFLLSSARGFHLDALPLAQREPSDDIVLREYDYSTTTTPRATATSTQTSNLTSPTPIPTTSDAETVFHMKSWPIHAALVIGAAASIVL
ncbi:hypothetical protein HYPSUDRAFT_61694 [Hypholoma sublateritium FD-334 SS-4]|uniref:Uncharacterized protein n=1 Tax=Hypholoma sublateritium (strain FD-334 SS-4) TaxID=945553 RepID=A0A0D2PDC6_HYPSF|nr:hypothetical protein HYPSUDRAFT_61694 [Hypholoma sublateritium FD-334 SS-4]